MKCFNLTDIETPELKQRGLLNVTLAVRSVLIPPGGSAEVTDDEMSRRDASHYIAVGALAVDVLPPSYVLMKDRDKRANAPPPESVPPPPARRRRS